ncbi:MAG TPA: class I SAM-dependent methyltransferase [Thermoplasmata archaeon]|nr:class I SAM-dependent methyltransferase [Thermoplasmata archaeon]
MPLPSAARDFDRISPEYDATRDPLDPETLRKIVEVLGARSITRLLEIGVGTGRVARPLLDAGVAVTGVDASRGMLARARAKGLPRLVRGNAYRLPFADRSFDAALFVHVLHVLDTPRAAIAEAARVARGGTLALVRPREGPPAERGPALSARRIVYRILGEQGYPIPPAGARGPGTKERDLLAAYPPDELLVLTEREVTEPLARSLDMMERRASRHTLDVPPEVIARAVAAARAEVGDRTFRYRRVEALASWRGAGA